MFINHFHMNTLPFAERIPSSRILQDERIQRGLTRLQYVLVGGTIALLTGDTGVGKSCLLKLFLDSMNDNYYRPAYLHITNIRSSSLLKLIVSQMGEIPRNTKERLFSQIIDKVHHTDAITVVIVDEAHLLSPEALIDLRLLVSSAVDERPPLKIILSGQADLRKHLGQSCLRDLADRISVKSHLSPLSNAQTHAYLDHHLNSVGANEKIFDSQVKSMIHEFTNGIPRRINNIATACLIQAAADNSKIVTQDIFTMAARECQI